MKTLMKKLTQTNRAMTDTTRRMEISETPENNPGANKGGAILGIVEGILLTVVVCLALYAGYILLVTP